MTQDAQAGHGPTTVAPVGVPTTTGVATTTGSPSTGSPSTGSPSTGSTAPSAPRRRLRADIEGLRAIAVGMVLLFHAAPRFVPGGFAGVDVFFVISGFLITGLIVREVERTGRLSLTRFWARRAKRLLPATALVLVTVVLLTHLLLSPLRWGLTGGDVTAAALYVVNWRLASQSLDYLAADYAPSPVQHFWSLAVEEQFYLVWPLVVIALALLAARRRLPVRRVLAVGLLALAVPSLLWSIATSGTDPAAYFVTTTRIWELALGAGVALSARRLERLPAGLAVALTWLGLTALVAAAFLLTTDVPWPGSAALWPTVATGLVIAAGPAARTRDGGAPGAVLLLGLAPMQAIGALSYSLYLWHWPLIVMATPDTGRLPARIGLLVVLVSFIPAYLGYRLLERPVHHSARLDRYPRQALVVGLVCTLIGVAAGTWLRTTTPWDAATEGDQPGAAAVIGSPRAGAAVDRVTAIVPDPLTARDDLPDLYARGCQTGYESAAMTPCEFGVAGSPTVVYLVGDSKAAQFLPTLQPLAEKHHWRLISLTKAGCPLADVDIVKGRSGSRHEYTSCTEWNAEVMQYLLHDGPRPDLVITTTHAPYYAALDGQELDRLPSRQQIVAGLHTRWQELNAAGIPVVALRASPFMVIDVAACVADNYIHLTRCATKRSRALRDTHTIGPAAKDLPGVGVVDLTSTGICPRDPCAAVIGNVLVYRDVSHLTAHYARTLAPLLEEEMHTLWPDLDVPGGVTDLWTP